MNITLRAISEENLPFLFQVYACTRTSELAQTGWPQEQQLVFLEMQFKAQHEHYQRHYPEASFDLILLDEEPIGRLYVSEWSTQMRIVDIALLSKYRGRGIGSSLLNKLFLRAREKNIDVSIHVEKNNPAMDWYQRLGFMCVEDKAVYSLMKKNISSFTFLDLGLATSIM